MDLFELHSTFQSILSGNISARVVKEAVSFCYQHHDQAQVLVDTLISTLKQTSPLKRLALFYVIDALVKQSIKVKMNHFKQLLLPQVVELIGLVKESANVQGVKKVLNQWKQKQLIASPLLEECQSLLFHSTQPSVELSKDAVWRRMEEDRDRVKKSREEQWSKYCEIENIEFLHTWQSCSPLSIQDLELFKKYPLEMDVIKNT